MSETNPKNIKETKIHKWNCKNCEMVWFLRVNETKEFDLIRLGKYERAITNHVMIEEHEVIHTEKPQMKIKFA